LKIGRKVREAERELVSYTLLIGDKELSGGDLTVRPRIGGQVEMSLGVLLERLSSETASKPLLSANTPRLLSKRPIFVG